MVTSTCKGVYAWKRRAVEKLGNIRSNFEVAERGNLFISPGRNEGMVDMGKQINEQINTTIMKNETDSIDWALCSLSSELYWWAAFFNIAFFKIQQVKMPVLSFEKRSVKNLGRYVRGRNGFGLKETININRRHLDHPLWEILAILAHEMCHSWQNRYGKPSSSWFHNKEFKHKMSEIGIVTDNKGQHLEIVDPFVFLLEKHGIDFDCSRDFHGSIKIQQKQETESLSKLKKWECLCGQTARIGKKEFFAVCTLCKEKFILAE